MAFEYNLKSGQLVVLMQRISRTKTLRCCALLAAALILTWLIFSHGSSTSSKNSISDGNSAESLPLMQTDLRILRAEIARLRRDIATQCGQSKRKVGMWRGMPVIYAITPTFSRPVQKAELTRLSQTFLLVPNFHWIVVEDAHEKSSLVANLLKKSGLDYTHLNVPTPADWKHKATEPNWVKPRGVLQRNAALNWIRDNLPSSANKRSGTSRGGVVYFADDDNVYDVQLFEEMRDTRLVSVWPVGLVGGLMVERPQVNASGSVVGWNVAWRPERPFAVDMAGFAINLQLLLSTADAKFSLTVKRGYQETELLRHLVARDHLEVKADNCTKVYVWHTRTETPKFEQEEKWKKRFQQPTDYGIEV